jgi:hypothetical protein
MATDITTDRRCEPGRREGRADPAEGFHDPLLLVGEELPLRADPVTELIAFQNWGDARCAAESRVTALTSCLYSETQ